MSGATVAARDDADRRVSVGSHRPRPDFGGESPPPQLSMSSRSRATTGTPAFASSPMPPPASSPGAAARRPVWADDNTTHHCSLCRSKFSFFLRKHHCRSCGLIFCAACTERKRALPHLGYSSPQRICDSCYDEAVTPSSRGRSRRDTGAALSPVSGGSRASRRKRTPTEATTPLKGRTGASRLLSGDAEPPVMVRGKAVARNNSHEDQWLRLVQESDSTVEKLREFLATSKGEGSPVNVAAVADEGMNSREAVHYAGMNRGGHALEILQFLVRELGLSLGSVAGDGMTVLHCACAYGSNVELVQWIVEEYPKELAAARAAEAAEAAEAECDAADEEKGTEASTEADTEGERTAKAEEEQLGVEKMANEKRGKRRAAREAAKEESKKWEVAVEDLLTAVDSNGNTALHHACSNSSATANDIVAYLLAGAGMDPSAKSLQGFNALHKLCRTKRVTAELLGLLLDHWPDSRHGEETEEEERSAEAREAAKANAAVEPEQKGLNRRFHPDQGLTCLMLVARHSLSEEAARCLLARGASVNLPTRGGETAATLAVASRVGTAGQIIAFLQVLQEHGVNLTLRNKKNESAAMQAILKSDPVLTRWLVAQLRQHILKQQQEMTARDSGSAAVGPPIGATPAIVMDALITACSRPNLPVLLALVDGAPRVLTGLPPINLNQPVEHSPEGNTALGELCGAIRDERELDCIIWLLTCGADPKKTNRAGQNAAHRLVVRFKDHAPLARCTKQLLLLLVLFWANHQVDLIKAKTTYGDSVMDLLGTRNPRLATLAQCRSREQAMERYGEKLAAFVSSRKISIAREIGHHEEWVRAATGDTSGAPSLPACDLPVPTTPAPPPPSSSPAPSDSADTDAADVSAGDRGADSAEAPSGDRSS